MMKKLHATEMRKVEGGYYYCMVCDKKFLTYAGALAHVTGWTLAMGIGDNSKKHWNYVNQK